MSQQQGIGQCSTQHFHSTPRHTKHFSIKIFHSHHSQTSAGVFVTPLLTSSHQNQNRKEAHHRHAAHIRTDVA